MLHRSSMGPVLERLHDELLDPLVKRVYAIARRNGRIPLPPPVTDIDLSGGPFLYVAGRGAGSLAGHRPALLL